MSWIVANIHRIIVVAGASKAIFIALVLSHGGRFPGYQAGIAIFVDLVWVAVFVAYLLAPRMTADRVKVGSRIGTA